MCFHLQSTAWFIFQNVLVSFTCTGGSQDYWDEPKGKEKTKMHINFSFTFGPNEQSIEMHLITTTLMTIFSGTWLINHSWHNRSPLTIFKSKYILPRSCCFETEVCVAVWTLFHCLVSCSGGANRFWRMGPWGWLGQDPAIRQAWFGHLDLHSGFTGTDPSNPIGRAGAYPRVRGKI